MKYIKVNIQELIATNNNLAKKIEKYLNEYLKEYGNVNRNTPFFHNYYPNLLKGKEIVFRVMCKKEFKNIRNGNNSGKFWSSNPTEYGHLAIRDNDLIVAAYADLNRKTYGKLIKTEEEARNTHYYCINFLTKDDIIEAYIWSKNKFIKYKIPINEDDKYSRDWKVRRKYYKNNSNDIDAKKDENDEIRMDYYKRHPRDRSALNDKSINIVYYYCHNNPENSASLKYDEDEYKRYIYYELYPDDIDALNDEYPEIPALYKRNLEEKNRMKDVYN